MKKAAPWMVALLAISAMYPVARAVKSSEAKAAEEKAGAPSETGAAEDVCHGKQGSPAWCEPVRVMREFFGLETAPEADRKTILGDVVKRAGEAGYDLHLLVALVPIPGDPRFDQALDAIQWGFAQSGSLIDRAWLPWAVGEAKADGGSQTAPGLLLFRKPPEYGSRRQLAVVFLVGETARAGIQKQAFHEALDLAADLQPAAGYRDGVVGILGPSFSGSAESLRLALAAWRSEEARSAAGRGPLRFRMATGSATASGLETIFREADPGFCRTVLPDSDLNEAALGFLRGEMGWDLGRVALLTEADTSYGRSLLKQEMEQARQVEKEHEDLVLVPFPSHISDLRNAFKEKGKAAPDASTLESQIQDRQVLDLDVADRERSVDLIPVSNPLTTREGELMLANLLKTMAREGIRYAGILATNVKDKLFLAEEIRRRAPDTLLFTYDSDLLYAHSQYAGVMDGMLVVTTAPLFTEGAPWMPSSLDLQGRERRQFVSGFEQGTYEAVRYLLESGPVTPPQAWIAAIGNGSLWPIARLPVEAKSARICGPPPPGPPAPPAAEGTGFTGKDDFELLLIALFLCVFSLWMRREALLEPVTGVEVDLTPGNRRLLALGSLLLAAAAGILLALASLPLWARGLSSELRTILWEPTQFLYLAALAFAYAFLVVQTARAVRNRVSGAEWIGWILVSVLLLVLLALGMRWLCIPKDQVELFYLRARALSSGLSPLISLAALGGAICIWLLNELVRRRLMARLAIDCPLPALCEPSVAGCGRALESLRGLLARTFPPGRLSWLLAAMAFLPPTALLWVTIQPVAETKGYGRLFMVLLVAAVALSALSFYRFVRLWLAVRWLLERLDHASPELGAAFSAVGKEAEWRPIKSFGWRLPPFKMTVLSVRRLRKLVEAGTLAMPGYPQVLDAPFAAMFESETAEGSLREIEHRNELERIFAGACRELTPKLALPGVREFLALRVAAYLRYVFAHMRSCLIGAMAPALLILLAVITYAYQPKGFVSTAVWLGLAVAVAATGLIFIQMDRNATLSRIGDTTPGQVTLDRAFWANFLTYAGIPLLGLVAAQIPGLGRLLGRVADQLLRVAGGG